MCVFVCVKCGKALFLREPFHGQYGTSTASGAVHGAESEAAQCNARKNCFHCLGEKRYLIHLGLDTSRFTTTIFAYPEVTESSLSF